MSELRRDRRPPLGMTIAWIVTLCVIALRWRDVGDGIWVDSDVYILGARTVMEGDDLYAAMTSEDLLFTYAPFAAVVFVPLALLPVVAGRVAVTALSLLCYAAVVALVGRRVAIPAGTTVLIGVMGLALEPLLRNVLLGQVNLVLMALVVIDCLVVSPRWRGFLVGVATGIKIVPGIFTLYFVLKRDWASAARSALGFMSTLVIGFIAAPKASAEYWGGGFLGLGKFGNDAVAGADNQSLLGVLLRLTGDTTTSPAIKVGLVALGVCVGVGAAHLCLNRSALDAEVRALACLALGGLLGSPISWSHHWVWAVVILLVLTADRRWLAVGLVSALMFLAPFWSLYEGEGFRLPSTWPEHLIAGSYVLLAPALLALVSAGQPCSRVEPRLTAATSGLPHSRPGFGRRRRRS